MHAHTHLFFRKGLMNEWMKSSSQYGRQQASKKKNQSGLGLTDHGVHPHILTPHDHDDDGLNHDGENGDDDWQESRVLVCPRKLGPIHSFNKREIKRRRMERWIHERPVSHTHNPFFFPNPLGMLKREVCVCAYVRVIPIFTSSFLIITILIMIFKIHLSLSFFSSSFSNHEWEALLINPHGPHSSLSLSQPFFSLRDRARKASHTHHSHTLWEWQKALPFWDRERHVYELRM